MKISLTKTQLGNDLLFETLRALSGILNQIGSQLIIVGATARDIALLLLNESPSKRKTYDLDVAVALDNWDKYAQLTRLLCENHFKKLRPKQKFVYKGQDGKNDFEVDVVPFGPIAENESVNWPPDGSPEMSVKCYEDVMAHAIEVYIEDITVRIAPLAAQFLIKLDTWIDRNDRENKDATDMMLILSRYYMARILTIEAGELPEEISFDNMDEDCIIASAEWIAAETAKMLTIEHLEYYAHVLTSECERNEDSRLLQHLTKDRDEDAAFWQTTKQALSRMAEIWTSEISRR